MMVGWNAMEKNTSGWWIRETNQSALQRQDNNTCLTYYPAAINPPLCSNPNSKGAVNYPLLMSLAVR